MSMSESQEPERERRPLVWMESPKAVGSLDDRDFQLPIGTVTFMLTDVEGSTRLWESFPEEMSVAVARHYQLLDAAIALHGGVRPLEQGEGDSVVAAFPRASDALAAALDIQRAFYSEPWPEETPLRLRIALHSAEAQLRDEGNYFGQAINRCARLRAVAHGGQVVLSRSTRDLALERLPEGVELRDLGVHRLRDLGRPEQVFGLVHPDLASEFPPLRSLDALPNNLPGELNSFVGRDAELGEVNELLANVRLLTLTGAGGCGKTRVALQTAADGMDRYPDGVWWIELTRVEDPALVPKAVLTAVGLREAHGLSPIDTVVDHFRERRALLVLDNCEHLLASCAELANALLLGCPSLTILATSREPLAVPSENAWRVPSMSLPPEGNHQPLGTLAQSDAVRLFIDRAIQVRPNFKITTANSPTVAQICRDLDGIPLAIELAAARVRMMAPEQIAKGLSDRFHLLTGGSRTVMPRHRTLEASMQWSHELLSEGERMLLRRLSVFVGGWTLDAAEEVCAGDGIDPYEVLELLAGLVDKSLVTTVEAGPQMRYGLLETVRQYAAKRLGEAGEVETVRNRHCDFFLGLAEQAEPELAAAGGPAWLATLEQEHDNLRAILEWAEVTGADQAFLRLVTALALFWELRGHLTEGSRWFSRALAKDAGISAVRARALWGAAHAAFYNDDFQTAAQRAPEALEMGRAVGDDWAIARALNTNGFLQLFFDPAGARSVLKQSIELGEKVGDKWTVADGWKMITISWMMQEDHAGWREPLQEFLRVSRQLDNKFFIAWHDCCVGWIAARRGEFDAARKALEASLELCDEVGEPATGGIAITLLAEIEALSGEYDAAEARLSGFLQRAAVTGGAIGAPFAVLLLSYLTVNRGDATSGLSILAPFLEQMRVLRLPYLLSHALSIQGAALLSQGEKEGATTSLREAREVAETIANPWLIAMADYYLGKVSRAEGKTGQSEDHHHHALGLRARAGLPPGVAESLEGLAALAADQESHLEAARLFGAAAALRRLMGLARWPAEQRTHQGELDRLRQALGNINYEKAWQEGEGLTPEEAVAYASRARGERKRPSRGWESLTPTEIETVRHVAAGLTNPQIGERMFISPGTVKVHLSHIFNKLSMGTRAELAAEATRRDLNLSVARRPS
jgi:predicted ATPase/class 3 adenylate cyclase/DNA-binding CsgD family transcriptional regulator